MIVVGIDYGVRRVALAVPSNGTAWSIDGPSDARSDVLNWAAMGDWVAAIIDDLDPTLVVIEHPLVSRSKTNLMTTMRLSMTAGALALAVAGARPGGVPVVLVDQAAWKKDVLGNGNLGKDEVARQLAGRFPLLYAACRDQDEVDAMCVALWGEIQLNRGALAVSTPS